MDRGSRRGTVHGVAESDTTEQPVMHVPSGLSARVPPCPGQHSWEKVLGGSLPHREMQPVPPTGRVAREGQRKEEGPQPPARILEDR